MSKYTAGLIKAKSIISQRNQQMSDDSIIDVEINGFEITFKRGKFLKYQSSLTLSKFHEDRNNTRIVMGPFGSGKTTGMIAEMVLKAVEMPVCKDGIRRCRWLIIRNTYNDLKRTCVKSVDDWLSDLGAHPYTYQQSPMVRRYQFRDTNGLVELDLNFISIDTEKQIRQLKSFETTNVWLSELSELEEIVLKFVRGRIGRYPMPELLDDRNYWCGVIAETNAPNMRHWIPTIESTSTLVTTDEPYKLYLSETRHLEKDSIKTSIYHQPEALLKNEKNEWVQNPYAENIENLEGGYGYYYGMLQNGEEFARVYIQGKYGTVQSGQPVFNRYNDDIHSVQNIDIIKTLPIVYGIDFGSVAPAIIACQWVSGQLRVVKEFCGDHMYIADLIREEFILWLEKNAGSNEFTRVNAYGRYDPAQTDHGLDQLREFNLDVRIARTNSPSVRLASVNDLLGRISSKGEPALLISRDGCQNLRAGFNGQYVYEQSRVHGETMYKDIPRKNHPYSDVHDALQYVALEFCRMPEEPKKKQIISTKSKSMWI